MQFKLFAISALAATAYGASSEKKWSTGSSVASWTGSVHHSYNGTGTSYPTWTAKSSGTGVRSTGLPGTTPAGTSVSASSAGSSPKPSSTGVAPFKGDAAIPTAAVGMGLAGVLGVVALAL